MKKHSLFVLCLVLLFLLAACTPPPQNPQASKNNASGVPFDPFGLKTPSVTVTVDLLTFAPTITTAPVPSLSVPSPTPEQTPIGMAPFPSNEAEMYSSYAYMVSYDPARGWADFDYFSMLRGEEAVEWLVEEEGYTLAAAQAEVENFADSEFIEKNTNPQLRTIDLREIPLKLMYHPDGTMLSGAEPIDATLADLYHLYELNPALLLDSFFYYVEAEGGAVVSLSQVYWP
ncbi:MAG: hypothetical protein ACYCX2_03275 [Christensenellales bacterium]